MYGRSDCNGEPCEPTIKFYLYMVGQSDHVGYARVGQIYAVADVSRDPGQIDHKTDDGTMRWFEHLRGSVPCFHAYQRILPIVMDVRT
jgi:hypothetical protein